MLDKRECHQLMAALSNIQGINLSGEVHVHLTGVVAIIDSHTEADLKMEVKDHRIVLSWPPKEKPKVAPRGDQYYCSRCGKRLCKINGDCAFCEDVDERREAYV